MSPPLIVSNGGDSHVSLLASSATTNCKCQNNLGLKDRNYMGISGCSSVECYEMSNLSGKDIYLNLKATELRLGLPGSQSPVRDPDTTLLCSQHAEKPLFHLLPKVDDLSTLSKTVASGIKRGFLDAMDGFSDMENTAHGDGNWMFTLSGSEQEAAKGEGNKLGNDGANAILSCRPHINSASKPLSVKEQSVASSTLFKEITSSKVLEDGLHSSSNANDDDTRCNNNGHAPVAKWGWIFKLKKAQIVGWPPIRSFRKNTLATNSTNNDALDGKSSSALFVKVSMDGAPYLRKVDLKTYSCYIELSSALEKMFSCFTIGQYGTHGVLGREMLNESKLRDLLHGSEFVLTYEDKDGDWMLVGDVPWEMFIDSCRRLRIMKSSDAVGLAPRAMEKCRNRN